MPTVRRWLGVGWVCLAGALGRGCEHRGAPQTHGPFPTAAEDLSDSDEVFAKEMTKWSSNDFLDTLEWPAELDEALGELWRGPVPKP